LTRIRAQATPDESGTHVVLTLLKEDTTEHGHDARERKPAVDLELQLARSWTLRRPPTSSRPAGGEA